MPPPSSDTHALGVRPVSSRRPRPGTRNPQSGFIAHVYTMTITGLSVAVALLIGSIELISVLDDDLNCVDR